MHWDWNWILSAVVAVASVILRHAIVTPKDHDTAAKIRHLADDAAAVIVATYPSADWAAKLQAVVDRLDALIPNIDDAVLSSAATGALMRLSVPTTTTTTGTITMTGSAPTS